MDSIETNNQKAAMTAVAELATEVVKVGAAWLRYGLSVGESSLEASARSLESTARVLGRVAARIRND